MKNSKVFIYIGLAVMVMLGVVAGTYYYFKTPKAPQSQDEQSNENIVKTDAQIQNEKVKDQVIHNSPEPAGIAKPSYQSSPTPPSK